MVGLDCSIIMNPRVWEASGHVGGFSDPMADCKKCKGRFRADQLVRTFGYDVLTDRMRQVRTPVYRLRLGQQRSKMAEQNAKKLAEAGRSA